MADHRSTNDEQSEVPGYEAGAYMGEIRWAYRTHRYEDKLKNGAEELDENDVPSGKVEAFY